MVELRKRKTPPPAPEPKQKKERKTKAKAATNGDAPVAEPVAEPSTATAVEEEKPVAEEPVAEKPAAEEPKAEKSAAEDPAKESAKAKSGPPKVGDKIDFDGFGGEIETNEGKKVTLKSLVEESKAGVVLFTYPKASTPGCTTQVCLFRDSHEPLTATGLSLYGLSNDSAKANTTFKTKHKLPYPLLCDPSVTLIEAIGLKKSPKGTQRGVFVVTKDGEVLAAEAGGPAATVEVVKKIVESQGGEAGKGVEKAEDRAQEAEKVESKL